MQRERVQDPYPWTWEVPLAVACVLLAVLVVTIHLARAVANLVTGAGWRWPPLTGLVTSLPGVLAGDAAAGLSRVEHPATPAVLWMWLLGFGLVAASGLAAAGYAVWTLRGPGRMRGMATSVEAHELLGLQRLRRVRHVVRPDLYPRRGRTGL
jgi:hypothetical protein